MNLTAAQLLAFIGAGAFLAITCVGLLMDATASQCQDTAFDLVGRPIGCLGRTLALLAAAVSFGLILITLAS